MFYVQDDDKFLNDVFVQLMDESISDEKRRDLVMFLKEFCNFSQNLQPQGKEAFYKVSSYSWWSLSGRVLCENWRLMPAKNAVSKSPCCVADSVHPGHPAGPGDHPGM
jgi:hypothetical protein